MISIIASFVIQGADGGSFMYVMIRLLTEANKQDHKVIKPSSRRLFCTKSKVKGPSDVIVLVLRF